MAHDSRAVLVAVALGVMLTATAARGGSLVVYGTAPGQSGPAYPGGTILEGDTVRIDDGGTVTGDIVNSGTLQFNQTSGSLAITGTYTGSATATLSLTSGGTVSLQQSTTTTIIDGAVNVQAGSLTTGTSALFIGSTGTGSLSISGNGNVATSFAQFASAPGTVALFTITGGTFTNTALASSPLSFAAGSASSGTFTMTSGTGSGGGLAFGPNSTATMLLSGGTLSWNWFEPAKGAGSTATITMSNSATRFISRSLIRMSMGTNSVATMTVNDGTVNGSQLVMGHGSDSVSTFTVAGGSVGFNGTSAATNGNMIGRAAGSSGTLAFTGGTTTFAGPTIVGGIGTTAGGGVSRGLVKVEGGEITTNTAASGFFSSVLENHFILGRYAPTTGEMVMTGGTFTAQRDFYVGGSGTGTLSRGARGAINLQAGGTLQIGTGTGSGGILLSNTGRLVNDGTLVFNRGVDISYSGVISGSGAVIKRGGINWLTFTATNTYAGLTSVEEGRLRLSGSGSLGTGGLSLAAGTTFDLGLLTAGTYTLPATGDLLGSGTLEGSGKTLTVLGSFLPGSTTGTFSVGSGASLDLSAVR